MVGRQGRQKEEVHEDEEDLMFTEMDDELLETVYYIICHKLIICCNAIPMCQLFCL